MMVVNACMYWDFRIKNIVYFTFILPAKFFSDVYSIVWGIDNILFEHIGVHIARTCSAGKPLLPK